MYGANTSAIVTVGTGACGKTVLCSSDTAVLCSNDTVVLCSIANGVLPGSDTDVVVCRAAAHFEKQHAVSDFWTTWVREEDE